MEGASELKVLVETTAERILTALQASGGRTRTAWDLKFSLKVPGSVLHLALGLLLKEGLIQIAPHGLTYRIQRHAAAVPGTAS